MPYFVGKQNKMLVFTGRVFEGINIKILMTNIVPLKGNFCFRVVCYIFQHKMLMFDFSVLYILNSLILY